MRVILVAEVKLGTLLDAFTSTSKMFPTVFHSGFMVVGIFASLLGFSYGDLVNPYAVVFSP